MEINKIEYEVGVYDLEGHFIDSSDSWEYLEKEFSVTREQIRKYKSRLSGLIKNHQLIFKPILTETSILPALIGNITKSSHGFKRVPVAKYYKDKLICVYSSISEAEELTGINRGNISRSCKEKCTAGEVYIFKYIQ